jgi:hypothetical protein
VLAVVGRLLRWVAACCCGRPRRGVVLQFEDGSAREYVLVRGRGKRWFARWRRVEEVADGEGEPLLG